MNFKVGVFAKGQVSGEVMNEAKKALQELALKYKCRFDISRGSDNVVSAESEKTEKSVKNTSSNKNGVYLSFGGELEL